MKRWGQHACLAILLGGAVGGVPAGETTHRVRPGESPSSIAKHYYGDYELSDLLLEYNAKVGTVIHPGETLRVPHCDEHRVRSGDTWSALSKRFLGRADAWSAVALLNDRVPEQPLQVGQAIVFPVILEHPLARGETLAVLAERYYADRSRSRVLQRFNGIDDPRRMSVGQPIEIPVLSLRLQTGAVSAPPEASAPTPPPETSAAADDDQNAFESTTVEVAEAVPAPPRPRFTDELRAVSRRLADGEFEKALTLLNDLRDPLTTEGSDAERAELWKLAAFLHVAFDEQEEACDAFRAFSALPGPHDLEPDLVSPKIRTTLAQCDNAAGLISEREL
jgi:LysM repeat protein